MTENGEGIRGEDAGEYNCFALNDVEHKEKMVIEVSGKLPTTIDNSNPRLK